MMDKKYTLLIADDEAIIRRELSRSFDWEAMGYELCGAFASGEQVLESMRATPADVLLLDIRMPGMGGLAALAAVKREFPATEVVILSAYDDFQYVREALKTGAFDYILKIELLQELAPVFARLRTRLDEVRRQARTDTGQASGALLDCLSGHRPEITGWRIDSGDRIAFFYADHKATRGHGLVRDTPSFAGYIEYEGACFALFRNAVGDIGITPARDEHQRSAAGISAPRYDAGSPRIMLLQALRAFDFAAADSGAVRYDTFESVCDNADLNRRIAALHKAIILADPDFPRKLETLLDDMRRDPGILADRALKTGRWLYSFLLETAERETGTDLRDRFLFEVRRLPFMAEILGYTLDTITNLFRETLPLRKSHSAGNIRQAEAIVDGLYMSGLKLDEVAAAVAMGPTTFKRRFREQTGKSFTAYLQSVRMRNARELLAAGDMRIYEIADQVGYSDEKYFRKVFRQETGLNPQEYRRKART